MVLVLVISGWLYRLTVRFVGIVVRVRCTRVSLTLMVTMI